VSHFERKFPTEGVSPTNHSWRQQTKVIALSCAIKISAVHCLVLWKSTRVTDRQTDRLTELRLPRLRYYSSCSRGSKVMYVLLVNFHKRII